MYKEEDKAIEAVNRAIDSGITYIDTAHAYGDGKSEERIGRVMETRRKEVTLATKIPARTADQARRQIELSLKRASDRSLGSPAYSRSEKSERPRGNPGSRRGAGSST